MYKNPKPTLDDEYVSRHFVIPLNFDDPMTARDAAENIENYIKTNGLPPEWVRLGAAKLLASPEQLNILKDRLMNPRLSGEWVPLAPKGDHIHCVCSVCGHMEEAIRAVNIGRSSDEYTSTVYKFCPRCGSSMAAGTEERARVSRKLRIESPHGRMEADLIPDDMFPGIAVTAIDEDGNEISCGILEWNETGRRFMLRVYSYENPDGDPEQVVPMSRTYENSNDTSIQKAVFAQVWEDMPGLEPATLTTTCMVNTNTREAFDIDEITAIGFKRLIREYVMVGAVEHPVTDVTHDPKGRAASKPNGYWYVKTEVQP